MGTIQNAVECPANTHRVSEEARHLVFHPVIGVVTQTLPAEPNLRPTCWFLGECYGKVLAEVGAIPWLIPLIRGDERTLRAIYQKVDGLLLAGGVDVDPRAYGETPHEMCDQPDHDRDWTEFTLTHWAAQEGKPILGICRGMQVLNVAMGGSLFQHLAEQRPEGIKHDYFSAGSGYARDLLAHNIRVRAHSRLARVFGTKEVPVNSMHHQGVKRLADGLHATAFAPDGLIEGIESTSDSYLVGVQWHPEELAKGQQTMRALFADFLAQCVGST